MADAQYQYGDTYPVIAKIATAQEVEIGDLVGLATDEVYPASDEAWDTNLATTQENFVANFLGVSGQKKDANKARVFGNSSDNRIRIDTASIYEFDTASASYAIGDLVGPAKQSGNALENQKVAAVAAADKAIGVVVESTSSSTRVKVQLLSTKLPIALAK